MQGGHKKIFNNNIQQGGNIKYRTRRIQTGTHYPSQNQNGQNYYPPNLNKNRNGMNTLVNNGGIPHQ